MQRGKKKKKKQADIRGPRDREGTGGGKRRGGVHLRQNVMTKNMKEKWKMKEDRDGIEIIFMERE